MTKSEMTALLENEYIPKILGFSYQKVNTPADAEDLASDIVFEVIKSVNSGRPIDNMNAFVWSVSNHTFCKWLRSKRCGTTTCLPDMPMSCDDVEEIYIKTEKIALLHREISLLAREYRHCVVLYYFEEKNCADIAKILGKSVGTIKWWLHEARKSLKEGMNIMRDYGEKSYRPETLFLSCQGNPGGDNEPMSCTKRILPQNILLAAYKEPLTVKQLCIELGASAPYIEDEIEHLVKNQLMKAVSGGTYQTDFVILPGRNSNIIHKIYATCFPRYYKELMAFLDDKKELLIRDNFNKAGFSWERLLWVYIPLITDFALSKFKQEVCKTVVYQDIPNRPNGGKWIALGYENGTYWDDHKDNQCWKEYVPLDGPVHKFRKGFVQGFFHYWSGPDSTVFFNIPDEVFILCREIINGEIKIRNLDEEQKYLFSIAVKTRLFMKEGDTFKQNYYYIKQSEFLKATSLALELYPIILPFFDDAYRLILDAYESTIPKHLRWQMGNFLSNGLGCFVTCTLYEAYHDGKLSAPDENSKAWLSLTATDEMPL